MQRKYSPQKGGEEQVIKQNEPDTCTYIPQW